MHEALVPSFPAPPAECSKVNKDGGPRPGPLTREGKRGLLPSPSFCSPQSWYYSHRPPEKMHMHLPMPRMRAYAEPIGLRPSAQRSPVITGRACCPRARSTRSGSLGGERPCLEPRSVLLSPRREWAMEHGWKPGPEWHDDGARTPGAARQASLGPPGCQPAPPQHQGSREALPRQRLSLRCQALWMRLRASSNFLLEASWMALRGRSTW